MAAANSLVEFVRSIPSSSTSPVVVFLVPMQCPAVPLLPNEPQADCEANFSNLLHQIREVTPTVQVYPVLFEESCPHSIRSGGGVIMDGINSFSQFPFMNWCNQHTASFSGNDPSAVDLRPEWIASTRPADNTQLLNSATCETRSLIPNQCPSCGYLLGSLEAPPPPYYVQQLEVPQPAVPDFDLDHEVVHHVQHSSDDPLNRVSSLSEQEIDEILALLRSPTP